MKLELPLYITSEKLIIIYNSQYFTKLSKVKKKINQEE